MATPPWVEADANGARLHLKVVPGAARSDLAGPWGERLRVRVAAPPEGGMANRALLALLAERLGVPTARLAVVAGPTGPLKTVRVEGLDPAAVAARLETGGKS